jgi:hypothetical protein
MWAALHATQMANTTKMIASMIRPGIVPIWDSGGGFGGAFKVGGA